MIHVFAESASGHLMEYIPDHNGGHVWNAYDHTLDAGGGVVIGASPQAIIDTNGLVHVFVDSTAGHLIEYLPDHLGGRVWNAYDHTLDAGGAVTIRGQVNAIIDVNGLVHVYVESTAGHLVEYLPDHLGGRVWNAYDHTLDAGGAVAIAAAPSAIVDANDRVHVYVESTAGHLVEYLPDHQGGYVWNAYDHTADAGGGGLIAGAPSAVFDPSDTHAHVFVRGAGNDLVEYVSDGLNGRTWNAYDRTVATGGPKIGADPTAVDDQGVLHAYAPSA